MRMKQVPFGPPRLRAVGWFGLAVTGCLAMVVGALIAADQVMHRPQMTLVGTLQSAQRPVPVVLPGGAQISELLVKNGDHVAQGQTLASYDHAALSDLADSLDIKLLVMRFDRECALDHAVIQDMQDWTQSAGPDVRGQLRLAAESCLARHQTESRALRASMRERDMLQDRARLIDQHILALQGEPVATNQSGRARTIMSALLAQSEIDTQLAQTALQIEDAAAILKQMSIDRTAALDAQINDLKAQRAQLARLLAAPRLDAPTDGRVRRVRVPSTRDALPQDVVVMEIVPDVAAPYVLDVQIDPEIADRLAPGTRFDLRMSGLDRRDDPGATAIWNPISKIASADGTALRVQIPLTPDSEERLLQRQDRIAFSDATSAAVVTFHPQAVGVRQSVVSALNRLVADTDIAALFGLSAS